MNNINLQEEIKTLTGQPVMLDQDTTLTYKNALLLACESYNPQPKQPGDMLKAYRLGMKILEVKEELKLDDDEIKTLLKIVDTASYPAVVIGRLTDFINTKN